MRQKLAINRCPSHGYWSVSIDDEHGGQRVTDGKCCGRWEVVKTFPLSQDQWRALAILATQAAIEADE